MRNKHLDEIALNKFEELFSKNDALRSDEAKKASLLKIEKIVANVRVREVQ